VSVTCVLVVGKPSLVLSPFKLTWLEMTKVPWELTDVNWSICQSQSVGAISTEAERR